MADRGEPIKVGVREFRGHLSDYLRQARQGARFLIMSRGKPIAEVGAPAEAAADIPKPPRVLGALKDKIWMAEDWDQWPDDALESFEAPL